MRNFLKNWAKKIARETWNRIVEVYSNQGLRVNEVTLTENLIYHFFQAPELTRNYFTVYEARNEVVDGNDLEILVETNAGYLMLACQAKRVYPNQKYRGFSRSNTNGRQIDSLIAYAENNGGIPLYFFYNGIIDNDPANRLNALAQRIEFSVNKYGCSFVHAETIKTFIDEGRSELVDFFDFHPDYAYPLHYIFDFLGKGLQEVELQKILENCDLTKLRMYNKQQVQNDPHWKLATTAFNLKSSTTEDEEIKFTPQARIIVDKPQ